MFHDDVQLTIYAGNGGNGSASFRREKYIPKGGPDGGDGGNGGDVFIIGTNQLSDLNQYASSPRLAAQNGVDGSGQKMYGKNGQALSIQVPVGTRIYKKSGLSWQHIVDIRHENRPFRLLHGGKGGLGNVHFATSTNQAPKFAQPGEIGMGGLFRFELQLIADVGIIGLPNAGKSTLLSVISDAKPKIANYPFTTLSPVLGIGRIGDRTYVFADIPGLIAGASHGKGLGQKFLRHLSRTKLFIHLIDATQPDYVGAYQTVRNELLDYDPSLGQRPELVVISKSDLLPLGIDADQIKRLESVFEQSTRMLTTVALCAASRHNLLNLMNEVASLVVSDAS